MDVVRTTVSADKLLPIINLPWATKNLQVELIVIPINEKTTQQQKVSVESLEGCLKEYANPALWEKEKYAWEEHIVEKYGHIPFLHSTKKYEHF